jgi:hypothetical protein
MDALCDARDVSEIDLVQQLREIKGSNRLEHENTRTQIATGDRHTCEAIKSEHEATRSLSTIEADDTRNRVVEEHYETRQHISAGRDQLHEAIEIGQAQTMNHAELQHGQTIATIPGSIAEQKRSTEQTLNTKDRLS